MIAEWIRSGKPTALGTASGAIAGLVAVTPASGFVGPISSIWIGIGAGLFCYAAVVLKGKLGYDDALDAFGIHGVGGFWGALATGLFASKAVNPAGADGLFFGNPGQLAVQALAAAVAAMFSFVGTFVLLQVVNGLVGLRVSREDEMTGLDLSQHEERAYSLSPGGTVGIPAAMAEKPALPGAPMPEAIKPVKPRTSILSSRKPPGYEGASHTTRLADNAFVVQEKPFELVIHAGDLRAVKAVWNRLCHDYPSQTPKEFNVLYPYVVAFSEDRLRFYKGDPDRFREVLERLLMLYGLGDARVELAGKGGKQGWA
jgi:hypothetical protein